jgi:hypothetical protein
VDDAEFDEPAPARKSKARKGQHVPAPQTGTPESHGLAVGMRVRHVNAKTGFGIVKTAGTIREFIEPDPGWHRALVGWDESAPGESDGCEQFIDVDKLARCDSPAPPPPLRCYEDIIAAKAHAPTFAGIETGDIAGHLFPHQRDLVRWSLRRGRSAIFADTGLGKGLMAAEWARHVSQQGRVLVLAPLAVGPQLSREAARFGVEAPYTRSDTGAPIVITNYELLEHFDASRFAGVVLDECFAAGTLVDVVVDGATVQRAIESIRVGDRIINASGVDTVSDIHRREVPYGVKVTVGEHAFICSPNHPIFTQRGWVGAQDLEPGDSALEATAAVRMVRQDDHAALHAGGREEILRSILLSELADASAGGRGEGSLTRSGSEARCEEAGLVRGRLPEGEEGTGAHRVAQSVDESRDGGEDLPPIESHEARTFRAWGQWSRTDDAATHSDECTRRRVGDGVCFVTGPTDSRLSHELQARLGERRAASRHRGGWAFPPQPEDARREEGREAGFARVDRLEVLESGHPELEQFRSPDGKLYFYDLGGTRHPSFSVAGLLVHNSSILKAFDGKTRNQLIDTFRSTPFKLCCTATPAPNDFTELGNHSEFLGLKTRIEMLAEFFVHDGGSTQDWRLKGHAIKPFWRWVATWGAVVKRPSDLGYSDEGFALPDLHMHEHVIEVEHDTAATGTLFAMEARTLSEQRGVRRSTIEARAKRAAEIAIASAEPTVIWCELNDEGDAVEELVKQHGGVQVAGADSLAEKESRLLGFADGRHRIMVTKAGVAGFGLNWQHCGTQVWMGASNSYERTYQGIRRSWRFGRKDPVDVHVLRTDQESAIVANYKRKEADAERMAVEMTAMVGEAVRAEVRGLHREFNAYNPTKPMTVPPWLVSETP